jgi:hypothetical protein
MGLFFGKEFGGDLYIRRSKSREKKFLDFSQNAYKDFTSCVLHNVGNPFDLDRLDVPGFTGDKSNQKIQMDAFG